MIGIKEESADRLVLGDSVRLPPHTGDRTMRVCPRCQQPLEVVVLRDVHIDRCRHCGGTFLDQDEEVSLLGAVISPDVWLQSSVNSAADSMPAEAAESAGRPGPGQQLLFECLRPALEPGCPAEEGPPHDDDQPDRRTGHHADGDGLWKDDGRSRFDLQLQRHDCDAWP